MKIISENYHSHITNKFWYLVFIYKPFFERKFVKYKNTLVYNKYLNYDLIKLIWLYKQYVQILIKKLLLLKI